MATALIIVDVQRDFLPGGALGVTDGHRIIRPLIDFGKSYMIDHVVLTRDWHPADHISFSDEPKFVDKSWPSHCVQGTPGAEIDPEIIEAFPDAPIVSKGYDRDVEAYSGFDGTLSDGTTLDEYLHNNFVAGVFVGGLALDYCVKATAFGAWHSGFAVDVLLDLTRPVTYLTGALAVADLAHWSGINCIAAEPLLTSS